MSNSDMECVLIPDRDDAELDRQFVINKLKELEIKSRENLFKRGKLEKE